MVLRKENAKVLSGIAADTPEIMMTSKYIDSLEVIPWGSAAHCEIPALPDASLGLCALPQKVAPIKKEERLSQHGRIRVTTFDDEMREVEIASPIETGEGIKVVSLRFHLGEMAARGLAHMLIGEDAIAGPRHD